jgi:hypothetical protein
MDSSSPIGIDVPNWLSRHQITVSTEESTMKISRVGVDLAKSVFQLHGADAHGKAVWKRKLSREKWIAALCKAVPADCEVGMEACAGAHHWARVLTNSSFGVHMEQKTRITC